MKTALLISLALATLTSAVPRCMKACQDSSHPKPTKTNYGGVYTSDGMKRVGLIDHNNPNKKLFGHVYPYCSDLDAPGDIMKGKTDTRCVFFR
jgi:hypothetical protein